MTEDEATKILIGELGWLSFMVELAIRAQFQCEYCGRQLLENVDAYDSWQKDHIVPNGDDALSNLAIAYKTATSLKDIRTRQKLPRIRIVHHCYKPPEQ